MPNEPLLILGTHNAKKGKELYELLDRLPLNIRTLADCDKTLHVVEDGDSFEENAAKKRVEKKLNKKKELVKKKVV